MIQRKGERSFLVRLDEKIQTRHYRGLRKGVKHFDKRLVFYRQPRQTTIPKNARIPSQYFSVTQELVYSSTANRLDLTVFLNGLPIITCELKNPLSGQTVLTAYANTKTTATPKKKYSALPLHGAFCRRYRNGIYDHAAKR